MPGSLKFVKHRDVTRAQVKVFNGQVWKDESGNLRAHINSLRALAAADPSCTLHNNIPDAYLHAREHHHDERRPTVGAATARAAGAGPARAGGAGPARAGGVAPVANRTRICVYWTQDPVEWYTGTVTSRRRAPDDSERWQSRVQYDDKHVAWHFLDGGSDSVQCDSSDEED